MLFRHDEALEPLNRAIDLDAGDPLNFQARATYYREVGALDDAAQDIEAALRIDPSIATLYAERGRIALVRSEFGDAARDLEKALALDPDDAVSLGQLGRALVGLERWDAARLALDRYVDVVPADPQAYFARAKANVGIGDLNAARRDILEAARLSPFDAQIAYEKAWIHRARGEWNEASEAYSTVLHNGNFRASILIERADADYFADRCEASRNGAALAITIGGPNALAYNLEALSLLCLQQFSEAHESALKAFELEPDDPFVLTTLGRVMVGLGENVAAFGILSRALDADPDDIDAIAYRAAAGNAIGMIPFAEREFIRVLDRNPTHYLALESLSQIEENAGNHAVALGYAERLAATFPNYADAEWRRGRLLVATGQLRVAAFSLGRAMEKFGEEPPVDLRILRCKVLYNLGRWSELREAALGILAADPQNAYGNLALGSAEFEMGNFREAIGPLTQAERLYDQPTDDVAVSIHLTRARSHYRLGEWAEAIPDFDRVVEMFPDDVQVLLERGYAHLKNGDMEKTIADADAVLSIEPHEIYALAQRLHASYVVRDMQGGLATASRIVALKPEEPGALSDRAWFQHSVGDYDSALRDYAKAAAFAREPRIYHGCRGDVLLRLGRLTEALEEIGRAIAFNAKDPAAHLTRGEIDLELGRYDRAVAALRQSVELGFKGPEPFYLQAIVAYRRGFYADALDLLARASGGKGDHLDKEIETLRLKIRRPSDIEERIRDTTVEVRYDPDPSLRYIEHPLCPPEDL